MTQATHSSFSLEFEKGSAQIKQSQSSSSEQSSGSFRFELFFLLSFVAAAVVRFRLEKGSLTLAAAGACFTLRANLALFAVGFGFESFVLLFFCSSLSLYGVDVR